MIESLIETRLRTTSPRCIRSFQTSPVDTQTIWAKDLSSAWALTCPCGSDSGTVLGYRLGDFKPGFESWNMLISPLAFLCSRCKHRTPILDTQVHGYGAEVGRITGGVGSVTCRGEGDPTLFSCPRCSKDEGTVIIAFAYDDSAIYELTQECPGEAIEDFFDFTRICFQCLYCGFGSIVSDLETK